MPGMESGYSPEAARAEIEQVRHTVSPEVLNQLLALKEKEERDARIVSGQGVFKKIEERLGTERVQ